MSNPLPNNNSTSKNGYSPEHVLTVWLEAATNFHQCYNQLIATVSQRVAEHDSRKGDKIDTGQCPIGQLLTMITRMQWELKKLARDMDQGDGLMKLSARENYEKLATHTLRLNQLIYQAQLRLDLSSLSTS
jgi:hypothetical protein